MFSWTVLVIPLMLLVPPAQGAFEMEPVSVVQAEGLKAVFECLYSGARGYGWTVNGTFTTSLPAELFFIQVGNSSGSLIVQALLQSNNSILQCSAKIRSEDGIYSSSYSKNASLTVFSIHAELAMDKNILTLSWSDHNFTTQVEYCVDVYQANKFRHILSECGLSKSQYSISNDTCNCTINVCDRLLFTVTPTEGEVNGTSSQPVTGFFKQVKGVGGSTTVSQSEDQSVKQVTFNGNGVVPNCTSYTSYEVVLNALSPLVPISGSITDPQFNGSLTFSLPTDKLTEVTVTLTDINKIDLVFENIPIKTTDIQDLVVSVCPQNSCIRMSVVFVRGSQSPGALVCVMPILTDDSLDYNNMLVTTIPQSRSVDISVPSGRYRLFAFDLESNGIPRMPISVAADSEIIEVPTNFVSQPPALSSTTDTTVTRLPNGTMSISCSKVGIDCVAFLLNSHDPSHLKVIDLMNDDIFHFTPMSTDGIYITVFAWEREQSILAGQLSFISELELIPDYTPTLSPQAIPDWVIAIISVIISVLGVALLVIVVLASWKLVLFMKKHSSSWDLSCNIIHRNVRESQYLTTRGDPNEVSIGLTPSKKGLLESDKDETEPFIKTKKRKDNAEDESQTTKDKTCEDKENVAVELEPQTEEVDTLLDESKPQDKSSESGLERVIEKNNGVPANETTTPALPGKNNLSLGSSSSKPKKQSGKVILSDDDRNQLVARKPDQNQENQCNLSNNKEDHKENKQNVHIDPKRENSLDLAMSHPQIQSPTT